LFNISTTFKSASANILVMLPNIFGTLKLVIANRAEPLRSRLRPGKFTELVMLPFCKKSFNCSAIIIAQLSSASSVLAPIWPVASKVLDGGFAVNIADVADAIKLLVEKNRVVAEGAGACPVAAARRGMAVGAKKIVCVVSGGGLDTDKLVEILSDVKNEEEGIAKGGRTGGKGNGGGCISNGGGNGNGTADDAASIFSVLWHAACVYTAFAVWNQHWA